MTIASRLLSVVDRFAPPQSVAAHCDVPCGIYDPEQARIEAESVYKIINKYHDSSDQEFRARCIQVKEDRAEICKHHISVLWSDYFKPKHLEQFPNLHDTCWRALKQCSEVKHSADADAAKTLLDLINEIDDMWKKSGGPDSTRVSGRPGA